MKVFAYNLNKFTITEVEVDEINPVSKNAVILKRSGNSVNTVVYPKWEYSHKEATSKVILSIDKEIERREKGLNNLLNIKRNLLDYVE